MYFKKVDEELVFKSEFELEEELSGELRIGFKGSPELYRGTGSCELEESEKNLCDELFFEEVLDSPEECFCFAAS